MIKIEKNIETQIEQVLNCAEVSAVVEVAELIATTNIIISLMFCTTIVIVYLGVAFYLRYDRF